MQPSVKFRPVIFRIELGVGKRVTGHKLCIVCTINAVYFQIVYVYTGALMLYTAFFCKQANIDLTSAIFVGIVSTSEDSIVLES